VIVLNLWGL